MRFVITYVGLYTYSLPFCYGFSANLRINLMSCLLYTSTVIVAVVVRAAGAAVVAIAVLIVGEVVL